MVIKVMNTIVSKLLLNITILSLTATGSWVQDPDVRTGRVDLITSGSIFSSSSVPIIFNITYAGGALSQTTSCGIGIVGFDTYITNEFSVNTTIILFQAANMQIIGQALDDTIIKYYAINYIAIGATADFIEVQFACFLPTTISYGNGTRSQSRTGNNIFVGKTLLCNVYLSGFRVHNSEGLSNSLSAAVNCPTGTGTLSYTFTAYENNTVQQICYTTVIFCEVCTQILYYDFGQIGSDQLSLSVSSSTINVLSRYEMDNGMFFGMAGFNISRAVDRSFNVQTDAYQSSNNLGFNYKAGSGVYGVLFSHYFIAKRICYNNSDFFVVPKLQCVADNNCPNDTAYTLNSSARFCQVCHYTCLNCDLGAMEQNCTKCSNSNHRVLDNSANSCPCISGYIDVSIPMCYLCSQLIPGCSICLSSTICTNCSAGFVLNSLGVCQCTAGFLVTGVCTTITGCISATNLGGTVYCLACNLTLNYIRTSNFSCVCNTGFTVDAVGVCLTTCGDSIVAGSEACDDGNSFSGDGCSSICQVQTNWTCNNSVQPSKCYISYNITAQVKYVKRILSSNTAEFAIKLSPQYDAYNYMNFKSFITTKLPYSSFSTRYQNNLLIVDFVYNRTIEGETFNMSLSLDKNIFNGSSILISLPASGMNAKLTLDSNYNLNYPLSIIVIILDIFAVIALFLTCISERMIGVQMIQTLQTVLYTMALMQTCPSTLSPLQYLVYSSGFNNIGGTDPSRTYPYTFSVSEVGIQKQFLLSYNLTYIILMLAIIVCLILKAILIYQNSNRLELERQYNRPININDLHKNHAKIRKGYKFVFERIFFVLAFMSQYLIFFGGAIQLSDLSADYIVLSRQFNLFFCGLAFAIMVTFLAMLILNSIYPNLGIFPMFMHKKYPLYYAIYMSAFIMLLSYIYTQTWMIYILMGFTLVNLIVILVLKPYQENIHNITILLNQFTILVGLGTYFYQQITPKTNNNESLFSIIVIAVIFMLYICVFLSFYRLYRFSRQMKEKGLSYNQIEDGDNQDYQTLKTAKALTPEQIEMVDKKKSKISDNNQYKIETKQKASFKAYDPTLKDEIKEGKHPLNDSYKRYPDTKPFWGESKIVDQRKLKQEEKYQTFDGSKIKTKDKEERFGIELLDNNSLDKPLEISRLPYDQFGHIKLHNKEEDYDALKVIKARLRKDFYQKVRGVQYKPSEEITLNESHQARFPGQEEEDQE